MTYEEINEDAILNLKRGWRPINVIENDYVTLMTAGGLSKMAAHREFEKLVKEYAKKD